MRTCQESIDEAKRRARETGVPHEVWRCNERFSVSDEGAGVPLDSLTSQNPGPVRPVAIYDPDGTEHG